MGRIRIWLRRVSIPAAFIICGLVCLIAALALTKVTLWFAQKNITGIVTKYEPQQDANVQPLDELVGFVQPLDELVGFQIGEYREELPQNAERGGDESMAVEYVMDLSEIAIINTGENVKMIQFQLMEEDQKKYDFFIELDEIAAIIWYSVCLCIAAFVFYLWKIKKPYHTLNLAVQKVSESNLDFQVDYEGEDEFGHLCHAFEIMRQELVKSNRKMWDSMEERKRLNAAFAHDLRTPLTIMQGHADLILGALEDGDDSEEEIRSSVAEISGQIKRLNAFAGTMGTLQRLEDYEPRPKAMLSSALVEMVLETARMLFPKGKVEIASDLQEQELRLDKEALAQICENILANAARYAKEKIMVCLEQEPEFVTISIEDDGRGFTKKDLENASLAYYRGEKTEEDAVSHFGLGLYTSSLLAQKLGGNLMLCNGAGGGAKVLIKIRRI